jgi:quinol-cytochrome oxidoreductase complex cytochrome b subunit/coenzyme F420-reducing hydrogenase delta subunit
VRLVKAFLRRLFERVEEGFDVAFTAEWNPFRQLGAMGWFFYWIVAVSGIYLYAFFDTGVTRAYESIEWIMNNQWYAGQVLRGLHRYASDALVVVVFLHLLREFALDRMRGARWFAWFTGIPLLWFLYACGISGYWLVWDVLAQYIAIATTEWLDTLPIFGEPTAANFLNSGSLSGRFFSLMVFIHIAVPLVTLLVMWVHIQRYAQPRMNPPLGLAAGTLVALVALSLVFPAVSQAPADLDTVPAAIDFDWFYLALYPLLDVLPGGQLWLGLAVGSIVLALLPWAPPARKTAPAEVSLDNCNGCGRCADDCPFDAIRMGPRTDGAAYDSQAVVDVNHCVGCGICAGACPTATPHRRATALLPGIQLPDYPIATLRDRTQAAGQDLAGEGRVLVFACERCGDAGELAAAQVGVVAMPCVGMLPPSFIDWVLARDFADGVLVNGCAAGDCYQRLGDEWVRQRITRQRDPYLRARVPDARIGLCWSGALDSAGRRRSLAALRDRLATAPDLRRRAAGEVRPG